MVILTGVRWYLVVLLIYSSLIKSQTRLSDWTELNSEQYWISLQCLLSICMSFLEKCLLDHPPIFWLGCLFPWHWAAWAISIFCRLTLLQLFHLLLLYSESWLFILFRVSFALQKLLSLIKFYLFILIFISITLRGVSKRILWWFMSKSILCMFSSESFIVFGFAFIF